MQLALIQIILSVLMGLTLLAIVILVITFIRNYRHNRKANQVKDNEMPKGNQPKEQVTLSQLTKDLTSAKAFCKLNKITPDYVIIVWREKN